MYVTIRQLSRKSFQLPTDLESFLLQVSACNYVQICSEKHEIKVRPMPVIATLHSSHMQVRRTDEQWRFSVTIEGAPTMGEIPYSQRISLHASSHYDHCDGLPLASPVEV